MKIAILTHPLESNYGGILQNFALQTVLKSMGHNVMTIDYHNDKSDIYRVFSYIYRNFRHFVLGQKHIPTAYSVNLSRKEFLKRNRNIQKFIAEHISTTEYISSFGKIKNILHHNFDCFIVGSDQVWLASYIPFTFLDFADGLNVKKIFYAASGDIKSWCNDDLKISKCKHLIKQFNAVSVREDSLINACIRHFDRTPELVLDPVLLMDKDCYDHFIPLNCVPNNSVVTYILDPLVRKTAIVEEVSAYLQLPILSTHTPSYKGEVPPIENWMDAIKNASYVITDSFHGMVLSLIFNKQFFVIRNLQRGEDRFRSILIKLNLEDRLISEMDDIHLNSFIKKRIDYGCVNQKLSIMRTNSLNFLYESLK